MSTRAALAVVLCVCLPAGAQVQRNFPANALRGELTVLQPLDVRVDAQSTAFAPGARVRDANNMQMTPGALVGRSVVVHYTRDLAGNLLDVWLLTLAERSRRPWPTRDDELRSWSFDPVAQVWSRP